MDYISDRIKFLLCNSDKFKIRLFFQFAFNCIFLLAAFYSEVFYLGDNATMFSISVLYNENVFVTITNYLLIYIID